MEKVINESTLVFSCTYKMNHVSILSHGQSWAMLDILTMSSSFHARRNSSH
jgi:hypothetical protein